MYFTSHNVKNEVMKQFMGKNFPLQDRRALSNKKSEQMMVKVLKVLSYARHKYKKHFYNEYLGYTQTRKIKNGFSHLHY